MADGRVSRVDEKFFKVVSSEGDRVYRVYVDLEKGEACSTDNGTTYKNYVGYPIISVLFIIGSLPYKPEVGKSLSGINWRRLNESFKNYALVEEEVKKITQERGVRPEDVDTYVNEVYKRLGMLRLVKVENCLK
ncbi:MAG: hypothetical protein QXP80_04790 [Zestosphaera sp.]